MGFGRFITHLRLQRPGCEAPHLQTSAVSLPGDVTQDEAGRKQEQATHRAPPTSNDAASTTLLRPAINWQVIHSVEASTVTAQPQTGLGRANPDQIVHKTEEKITAVAPVQRASQVHANRKKMEDEDWSFIWGVRLWSAAQRRQLYPH